MKAKLLVEVGEEVDSEKCKEMGGTITKIEGKDVCVIRVEGNVGEKRGEKSAEEKTT